MGKEGGFLGTCLPEVSRHPRSTVPFHPLNFKVRQRNYPISYKKTSHRKGSIIRAAQTESNLSSGSDRTYTVPNGTKEISKDEWKL